MSGYDEFEKIFGGSWLYDRDEKLEEFMDSMSESFCHILYHTLCQTDTLNTSRWFKYIIKLL